MSSFKKALLACTIVIGFAPLAARADQFHTARTWYSYGGFTVEQVVNDTNGGQFCVMERGQLDGSPRFSLMVYPKGLQLLLIDPSTSWLPGRGVLRVDNRAWNVTSEVDPRYPDQLKFDMAPSVPLVDFMVAMAFGSNLSIEGAGRPDGSGTPFHYNVSLFGSNGAMTAELNCAGAIGMTPGQNRPRMTVKNVT